jgi:beta-lactamase regulating signal transducer with metallopeptidase domain
MHAIETFLARPEVERLGWVLLHFVWQGALIAALCALALAALRRSSANLRYMIACAALLAMAACLPATWFFEGQAAPVAVERVEAAASPSAAAEAPTIAARAVRRGGFEFNPGHPESTRQTAAEPPAAPPVAAAAVPPTTWRERIAEGLPWFVIVWLAGVFGLSVRLAIGWSAVHRLRRGPSQPANALWQSMLSQLCGKLGIRWSVKLLESALVDVPTMIGWPRPVVLWPPALLSGLSVEQFEALLAHELAHVRRHDYLVNLVQTAIETLLFYHPAVWWLSRRIRHERECCCDDLAVSACGNRLSYARALATLEELRSPARQLALAADGGRLLTRIRRIIGLPAPRERSTRHWLLGLTLSATLLMLAIGIGLASFATGDEPSKASGDQPPASKTTDNPKQVAPASESQAANGVVSALVVQTGGAPGAAYLDDELADRIKAIPHVKSVVNGGLLDVWSFREEKLDMVFVSGRPPEYTNEDRTLKAGRWLKPGDHKKVLVSPSVAEGLYKSIGDKIHDYGTDFEIVGIVEYKEQRASNFIEMPLADLQDLKFAPGKVMSFLVGIDIRKVASPEQQARLNELRERICALDEAIRVFPYPDRLPIPRVLIGLQPTSRSGTQYGRQRSSPGDAATDSKPIGFELGRVIDDATGKRITNYRGQWGTVQSDDDTDAVNWGPAGFGPDEQGHFGMLVDWYAGQRARIVASGYVPQPIAIPPRAGRIIVENVVRMKRGGQIAGRVVDYAGKPVAGASVFVVGALAHLRINGGKALATNEMQEWVEDAATSPLTTDAKGRFTVTGIGGDAKYLAISCPALDLWIVPAPPATEPPSEFEIRLPQAGKLVVRFDIPGGGDRGRFVVRPFVQQPLRGDARGQAWRYDYMARWNDNEAGVDYGLKRTIKPVSESVLDNLPPGDYVVERIKEFESVYGVITTAVLDRSIVKVVSGKTAAVNFARPKGTAVGGQVVGLDRPEMRKATPARMFVTVEKASETGGTKTPPDKAQNLIVDAIDAGTVFQNGDAPDGRFTTEQLPPGKYRITANLFDDSQSDVTTLDKPPLFAGEALITVADDGQPPPVKIELKKNELPAKPAPPPSKPSRDAPPSKESGEKPRLPTEAKPAEPAKPAETAKPQDRRGRAGFIMAVQKKAGAASDDHLPEKLGERIKKLPHVKAVSGWLMDFTPIDPLVNASVMLIGWPPDSIVLDNWKFVAGRFPRAEEHHKIVVGKEFAAKLSLKAGDTMGLYGSPVEILGVFETAYAGENDGIYMLLSDLQEITKRPHQVSSFAVTFDIPQDGQPDHKAQTDELRKQIEALGEGVIAFVAPDPPAPPAQITAKPGRLGSAEAERAVGAVITWLTRHSDSRVDLIIQKTPDGADLNNDLPESLGDRIRKLSRVKNVTAGLMDVISFEERNVLAVVIDGLQADSPFFERLKILSGRKLDAGDHHKVILGKVLAANLGKKVGDIIRIYDTPLEIAGVFESKNAFENGAIFTLLADMQDFMNRQHRVTGFLVRTDIPNDDESEHKAQLAEVRKEIQALDKEIVALAVPPPVEPTEKPAKKSTEAPPASSKAEPAKPAEQPRQPGSKQPAEKERPAEQRETKPDASATPIDGKTVSAFESMQTGTLVPAFESMQTGPGLGPAPPAKPIEVSGQVIDDASNKPLASFSLQQGQFRPDPANLNRVVWSPGTFPGRGDGRFTAMINWDAGQRMRIVASGYAPEPVLTEPPKRNESMIGHVIIRLKRGSQVSGRVVDYQGRPVAGASLFVIGDVPGAAVIRGGKALVGSVDRWQGNKPVVGWHKDESVVVFGSDNLGQFTVEGVSEAAHLIAVSCPALDLQIIEAPSASQPQRDFEIRLRQPGKLIVHYEIPGAPEEAHFDVTPEMMKAQGLSESQANSIANGAPTRLYYEIVVKQRGEGTIDSIPPGDYQIVRKKEIGPNSWDTAYLDNRIIRIVSGHTTTVDFVRDTGVRVHGQIVGLDREELSAAKGPYVTVSVQKPGDTPANWYSRHFDKLTVPTRTALGTIFSDAKFTTERLPPGQYMLVAQILMDADGKMLHEPLLGMASVTVPEKGEPPPVRIQLVKRDELHIGAEDAVSDNPWSRPVGGLQARLTFEHRNETNGTTIIATYLELRNVAGSATPLEVPLDPRRIEFTVTDAAGKEEAQALGILFSAMPEPGMLRLPHDSQLRLSVAGSLARMSKDQGSLLSLSSEAVWAFNRGDVGAYYLRAKIAIPKTDEHLWNGTIEIPDTRIPGVTTP